MEHLRVNMRSTQKIMASSILIILLTVNSVVLPAKYKLDEQVSFIYINGTSTLHDWTIVAEKIRGSLSAKIEEGQIQKLDSVQINIPVAYLKSGKQGMDENMYKALKSNQFPEISYKLKSHIIKGSEITVNGELTIAGVTKIIKSKVTCQNIGNHFKTNGELTINMSDFDVTPPEFLLGAFKAGNKVTIRFYFMFCDKL